MGRVIGLISLKGGVGKTTLSVALACDLSYNWKKKVLLIDANYSAPNLGMHMGIISPKKTIHDVLNGGKFSEAIHNRWGVDVIPGNFLNEGEVNPLKLRDKLSYFKKNYDFIILDASPSLNDEVLSTILASDSLFVITTPDYPTLSCSIKAVKIAKQRNKPIEGIILNKVKKRFSLGLGEIQESAGVPVVASIDYDEIADIALYERVPATLFAKKTKFVKEVSKFSSALLGEKEKMNVFQKLFSNKFKKEVVNREVMREFYRGMFSDG
jgi:MinD-like ATPase involved in chromosome partitioning or flagellar assembly